MSPELREQVMTMLRDGASNSDIVSALGVTLGQVAGVRHRLKTGPSGPPERITTRAIVPPKRDDAKADHNQRARDYAAAMRLGFTVADIAITEGLSRQRIEQIMQTACPPFVTPIPRATAPHTAAQEKRPDWSYPDPALVSLVRSIRAEMGV